MHSLLYEHDKQRVSGYEARINKLLEAEESVIESLKQADHKDLDMILIKIRTQQERAKELLAQIKKDNAGLEGEYLAANGIYVTTAEAVLERFGRLRAMTEEAKEKADAAEAAGEAAKKIDGLKSFARQLKEFTEE